MTSQSTEAVATNDDHQLYTIQEAAEYLRTPVATLRYWRHLGVGPHSFRMGRRLFYRLDDLKRWVDEQHDHQGPDAA